MTYLLVIDIGTSSIRGILYNDLGEKVERIQIKSTPTYFTNGNVEQNPKMWEKLTLDILQYIADKCLENNYIISGIVLTGQRSSLIPVDKNGRSLCDTIMWQDKRSSEICEEYKEYEDEVYKLTGIRINPVFTAPKMLWLKRNNKEIYDESYKLITILEYITYILTKKFVCDYTIANRSLLFNVKDLKWDDRLLEIFQIDREKLGNLVKPGEIIGYLDKEIGKQIGIYSDVPIILGGGDQQCAAIGMNVIEKGDLLINNGTGTFILAISDKPIYDEKKRFSCNASSIEGKWIIEASILNSGSIYRWFNENFYNSKNDRLFEKINDDAINAPVGSNGLILLPYLCGSGSPYWDSKDTGCFWNINMSTTKSDFARAIIEGIILEIENNISIIDKNLKCNKKINTSGGLTNFNLFNQIQADIYDKDIVCNRDEEATAKGAWVLGCKAIGLYEDISKALNICKNEEEEINFSPQIENKSIYDNIKYKKNTLYEVLSSKSI